MLIVHIFNEVKFYLCELLPNYPKHQSLHEKIIRHIPIMRYPMRHLRSCLQNHGKPENLPQQKEPKETGQLNVVEYAGWNYVTENT